MENENCKPGAYKVVHQSGNYVVLAAICECGDEDCFWTITTNPNHANHNRDMVRDRDNK